MPHPFKGLNPYLILLGTRNWRGNFESYATFMRLARQENKYVYWGVRAPEGLIIPQRSPVVVDVNVDKYRFLRIYDEPVTWVDWGPGVQSIPYD